MFTRVVSIALGICLFLPAGLRAEDGPPRWESARKTAETIDALLADHWRQQSLEPAPPCDDLTFLRRATLDLAGRIPTPLEMDALLADSSEERRPKVIRSLIEGPEFPLQFGRVLDDWIQQRSAGDEAFLGWLRTSLAEGRSWETIFRSLLIGPWEQEAEQPASRFLSKRIKSIDSLTNDTSQAFFGVDITCARCHDHPLVDDWTQHHYYGLAAFFGRTYEAKKNSGQIGEKSDGEVTFEARSGGKQTTAAMMFLTGQTWPSAPKQNRREQLVKTALEERTLFSRAAVNRMWTWFFGRGLVEPVNQMHSANPSCVPGLLEWLAGDFAASGYDLHRLAMAIGLTHAYGLSSHWPEDAPPPETTFAVARLRPLTKYQWSLSAAIASGDDRFASIIDPTARKNKYLELEKQAASVAAGLDPTSDRYQASVAEALFLANHPAVQQFTAPAADNLAARIVRADDFNERVRLGYRTLLTREPTLVERTELQAWWGEQVNDESAAGQLLWALLSSAEFRFNH